MKTWLNAFAAPWTDQSDIPENEKPSTNQVAIVYLLTGFIVSRVVS